MSDTTLSIDLAARSCKPCEQGAQPLSAPAVAELLKGLNGWSLAGDGQIFKTCRFRNYHETMAFVNAVAWISHVQNHHPDLEVGYSTCTVRYSTHAVGGLSENDFICAAKVDALFRP